MLPESSVRQLKKLRAETKGTDIGDLTTNDRLNKAVPNLQAIGNPVDNNDSIESWEEFSKKDSKLQTIAFKSKLVNKSIKENNNKDMSKIGKFNEFNEYDEIDYDDRDIEPGYYEDEEEEEFLDDIQEDEEEDVETQAKEIAKMKRRLKYREEFDMDEDDLINDEDFEFEFETVKTFEGFHDSDDLQSEEEAKSYSKDNDNFYGFSDYEKDVDYNNMRREELISLLNNISQFEVEDLEEMSDDELEILYSDLNTEEAVETFESFTIKSVIKEKQPEYEILGKEKERESNPNFGVAAVINKNIKKITDLNVIDPPTPKERTIGGSAGQYIDNGKVKGFVNRIEGKDVYVESATEPMKIEKFNIKDVVKTKKEDKE